MLADPRIHRSGYAWSDTPNESSEVVWNVPHGTKTLRRGDVPESFHRSLKVRLAKLDEIEKHA